MEYRFKLHSFVDVITNSSTEIFTTVQNDGPEKIHEMINIILDEIGSSERSKDLFDIQLVPSGTAWDSIVDRAYDDEDFIKEFPEYKENYKDWNYSECKEFLIEDDRWKKLNVTLNSGEYYETADVCIISKKTSTSMDRLVKILDSIFESEEYYC